MKRVIITGATGFIGSNLTRRLLHDGHEIHLLVRPGYTMWRIKEIHRDVRLYEVEFGDEKALSHVVYSIRPDWVFHLAVYGAYSWQADVHQMVQTNIIGTINLVEACLKTGFEAFINTGSSSEYGFKDHAPSESEYIEPNSQYALTKASATLFCRYTAQSQRVHLVTLRLYSVYGPFEEPKRFMPTLILHGLKGELPPLANPDTAHDFVYVEDAIEAYLLAATRPHQELGTLYNIGTGVQTSLRDVVEIARRLLGIKSEPKWGSMANHQWDTNHLEADNQKIRNEFGWQPQLTFEQGFRRMMDWFSENPTIELLYRELSQKGK